MFPGKPHVMFPGEPHVMFPGKLHVMFPGKTIFPEELRAQGGTAAAADIPLQRVSLALPGVYLHLLTIRPKTLLIYVPTTFSLPAPS